MNNEIPQQTPTPEEFNEFNESALGNEKARATADILEQIQTTEREISQLEAANDIIIHRRMDTKDINSYHAYEGINDNAEMIEHYKNILDELDRKLKILRGEEVVDASPRRFRNALGKFLKRKSE